ncbi:hypothetical protein DL96DRAFT_443534 [Flagelloscypha sp. PMI_526]|nr:hypothetical protein DL96DRAFT_443534 [Flagelloscypha sp. PMI_526]
MQSGPTSRQTLSTLRPPPTHKTLTWICRLPVTFGLRLFSPSSSLILSGTSLSNSPFCISSLSRRFSLLRSTTGQPVSIDSLRVRLAEQRARGDPAYVLEEEEDMILDYYCPPSKQGGYFIAQSLTRFIFDPSYLNFNFMPSPLLRAITNV